jgi:hypothetical protein
MVLAKFGGPRNGPEAVAQSDANGDAMRQRIDHLEDLVKRLAAERGKVSTDPGEIPKPDLTATSDSKDVEGGGKTLVDGIQSVYLSGDDWYSVLQEVSCFFSFLYCPSRPRSSPLLNPPRFLFYRLMLFILCVAFAFGLLVNHG